MHLMKVAGHESCTLIHELSCVWEPKTSSQELPGSGIVTKEHEDGWCRPGEWTLRHTAGAENCGLDTKGNEDQRPSEVDGHGEGQECEGRLRG